MQHKSPLQSPSGKYTVWLSYILQPIKLLVKKMGEYRGFDPLPWRPTAKERHVPRQRRPAAKRKAAAPEGSEATPKAKRSRGSSQGKARGRGRGRCRIPARRHKKQPFLRPGSIIKFWTQASMIDCCQDMSGAVPK